MKTVAEIVAAVTELVTEDKENAKTLAKALRDNAKPVAQLLINVGAGKAKGEADAAIKAAEEKAEAATKERDELQAEFDDFKAKTPDLAAREAQLKQQYDKKLAEKETELKAKTDAVTKMRREQFKALFIRELESEHGGQRVDREWAEKVVAREFEDRYVTRDDGSEDVLQPGETTGYDAPTFAEKVKLLAADARKTVPDRYLVVGGQSGGGTSGGHGTGGYDPVAAGKAMADAQKGSKQDPTLAFR